MVSYEDIESIIEEWFSDYSICGNVEIARLYAHIRMCAENQLEYHMSKEREQENGKL